MNYTYYRIALIATCLVATSASADIDADLSAHQTSFTSVKSSVSDLASQAGQTRINDATSAKTAAQTLKTSLAAQDMTGATTPQTTTYNTLVTGTDNLILLCDDATLIGNIELAVTSTMTDLNSVAVTATESANTTALTDVTTATTPLLSQSLNALALTGNADVGTIAVNLKNDYDAGQPILEAIETIALEYESLIDDYSDLRTALAGVTVYKDETSDITTELAAIEAEHTAAAAHASTLASNVTTLTNLTGAPDTTTVTQNVTDFQTRLAAINSLRTNIATAHTNDTILATTISNNYPNRPESLSVAEKNQFVTDHETIQSECDDVIAATTAAISAATTVGTDADAPKVFAEKMKLNAENTKDDSLYAQLSFEADHARNTGDTPTRSAKLALLTPVKTRVLERDLLSFSDLESMVFVPNVTSPSGISSTDKINLYLDFYYDLADKQYRTLAESQVGKSAESVVQEGLTEIRKFTRVMAALNAMRTWLNYTGATANLTDPGQASDAHVEWSLFVGVYGSLIGEDRLSDIHSTLSAQKTAFDALFANMPTAPTNAAILALARGTGGSNPIGTAMSAVSAHLNNNIIAILYSVQQKALAAQVATSGVSDPDNAPTPEEVPSTPDLTFDSTTNFTQEVYNTVNDSSTMLLSGSGDDFGRLRELALSGGVDKLNADVRIFMDKSAHLGLGSANLSTSPGQTLNVLGASGANSVQIIPNGNCVINLNSDVSIVGSYPLIPTENFGKNATHRIIFTSEVERKITVTAGTEWDLSGFNAASSEHGSYAKQIMFSGKVRLVLERGASIRLPYMADGSESKAPVLYFNDDSRLIIEESKNRDEARWDGATIGDSDNARCKFFGCGQVWMNKNAQMHVMGSALFGVEADATTPKTNVTLSLQRRSCILIGDENKGGGAFQVGNMSNVPNTSVSFDLTLNGPSAQFLISHNGFFGLAAGTVNKYGNPNGSIPSKDTALSTIEAHATQYDAWRLQRLYNVSNITLNIKRGIFSHNVIADGSADSREGSVMAIGPLMKGYPESKYLIKLGDPLEAIVKGGGNLVYLHTDRTTNNPLPLSIWDAHRDLNYSSDDNGAYSLLAPHIVLFQRRNNQGATIEEYKGADVIASQTSYIAAAGASAFYDILGMGDYSSRAHSYEKYTAVGQKEAETRIGYVLKDSIYRSAIRVATRGGDDVSPNIALPFGYLIISSTNDSEHPSLLSVP